MSILTKRIHFKSPFIRLQTEQIVLVFLLLAGSAWGFILFSSFTKLWFEVVIVERSAESIEEVGIFFSTIALGLSFSLHSLSLIVQFIRKIEDRFFVSLGWYLIFGLLGISLLLPLLGFLALLALPLVMSVSVLVFLFEVVYFFVSLLRRGGSGAEAGTRSRIWRYLVAALLMVAVLLGPIAGYNRGYSYLP